jgi:hypothetical protein
LMFTINFIKKFHTLFGLTAQQAQRINRNSIINDVDTIDGYQVNL